MGRRLANGFQTESELAAVVIGWLAIDGWDVYQEVEGGSGVCDIVAVRGPVTWAIETKLAFGTVVLDQARSRISEANLVSVATPITRARSTVLEDYCFWKGIGWLTVSSSGDAERSVKQRIEPGFNRHVHHGLRAVLRPEHKTFCAAGSARGGHWTPFKGTCRAVAEAVREKPGITLRELLAGITTHYANKSSARSGIVHWAEEGKIPGVEVRRRGREIRLYPPGAPVEEDPNGDLFAGR